MECFSGVKTSQNSKTEGEIERKKHENVKLKEVRCAWSNFSSRKTRRMHRETTSEMASLPWCQNNRKENAARTKVTTRGPGSS